MITSITIKTEYNDGSKAIDVIIPDKSVGKTFIPWMIERIKYFISKRS